MVIVKKNNFVIVVDNRLVNFSLGHTYRRYYSDAFIDWLKCVVLYIFSFKLYVIIMHEVCVPRIYNFIVYDEQPPIATEYSTDI